MDDKSYARLRQLAGPIYFLACLLVFLPLIDLILNIWPIRMGSVDWRYSAIGLGSGFLLTPFLGLLVWVVAANYFGDRKAQIVVALISAVLALTLALASMAFVLDVLQLRPGVTADRQWAFKAGAARAIFKNLLGIVAAAWLAMSAFRSLPPSDKASRREGSPLFVGKPEA